MSLSLQILAGLLLGVAVGLFFGEPLGALAGVGDAFVKLLQMTVLPYVTASLIAGLGRMEGGVARLLALRGGLRLAMPADRYFAEHLSRVFPNAKLMQVDRVETFLKADPGEYDALLYLAEAASAWTLLHPEFAVVVPRPGIETVPLAYLLPEGQPDGVNSVDAWIELKKRDGTIQRLYDYWILGPEAERTGPRWSVVRNVLHWVD